MSVAGSQAQTFLRLLQPLRSRWRSDAALPRTIQTLLAAERRFGSRDRRLYRELIYTTLRYLPWIEPSLDAVPTEALRRIAWLAADTPATRLFRQQLAIGEPPVGDATDLLPPWFRGHSPELFARSEAETQLRRASLWLRLQTDEAGRAETLAEFAACGWECRLSALLPDAIEVRTEADVTQTESWRAGRIEVQDLGSQLLLEAAGIERGGHWLDACAGAGGKTLQLARLLGPEGMVDAHDIRPAALEELKLRATRARLRNIRVVTAVPTATFAGVLVDAPCSGSGTWRRSPHLKWTTTPATIAEKSALQATLLARFAPAVRTGGRLIYATCSLSRQENEQVVAAFLQQHPDFAPAPFRNTFGFEAREEGLTLLPSRHDTDGFFVANLRRR